MKLQPEELALWVGNGRVRRILAVATATKPSGSFVTLSPWLIQTFCS